VSISPDPKKRRTSGFSGELVLQTALQIIDEEGVEGLSMRRLARALDRDPMSIYRHAATKAELLDGVVELVLGQLTVDITDEDWAAQLRHVAHQFRDIARSHPHVVPLLVTRPLSTPLGLRPLGTLRPLEAILELLIRAGFSDVDALHVYRSFYGFVQGHVLNELQELVHNHEETDDLLRLGLHRLPLREFPRLRSLAPTLAVYDGAAELDQGVDMLLAGLQSQLRPSGPRRS
jgi:AcrR family transcriptional regulator